MWRGPLDELLHVEVAVAEGARGLAGCLLEERGQFVGGAADAHSAPATAGDCLQHDGVADGACASRALGLVFEDAVGAGQDGDFGLLHGLARGGFFAHEARDLGRRADELDVGGAADLGEVGVLAEQAVAGMDGVDIGDLGGGDDGGDVEVALGGARRADADGLVGKLDVQAVPVRLAVDGDGADAHLRHAQMTRRAISPRFAIRILRNMSRLCLTYNPNAWTGAALLRSGEIRGFFAALRMTILNHE